VLEQPTQSQTTAPHSLILEQRKKLSLSGVRDVELFEEERVLLQTTMGRLTLQGSNLKMGSFNAQTGDLSVTGDLYALVYTNDSPKREGFLSRVFK